LRRVVGWLFLLLCVMVGCQGGISYRYSNIPSTGHILLREIPVYVDKEFSIDDKLEIEKSLEEWNYVLNGYMDFRVVSYHFDMQPEEIREAFLARGLLIMKVDSSNPMIPDNDFRYHTMAWTNSIGGNKIWVVRDRIESEKRLKEILLHEEGHSLGSEHIAPPSLMAPIYNAANFQCIDLWTATAVANYQGLPISGMNWCSYEP
jgi:matrixin